MLFCKARRVQAALDYGLSAWDGKRWEPWESEGNKEEDVVVIEMRTRCSMLSAP